MLSTIFSANNLPTALMPFPQRQTPNGLTTPALQQGVSDALPIHLARAHGAVLPGIRHGMQLEISTSAMPEHWEFFLEDILDGLQFNYLFHGFPHNSDVTHRSINIFMTGGVTAFPYCFTVSRWLPFTV